MALNYDLHAHSTASDGTLSPAELVVLAQAQGVDVLALTDHDDTAGVAEAQAAAAHCGVTLVPGVEISVSWRHQTLHVLGLAVDPDCQPLARGLATLRDYRTWRAEEIARGLAAHGIDGALAGAAAHASGQIISRTHFARFLVEHGHARDVAHVFKRFLVRGRPGYVASEWAPLEDALDWIQAAGGLAVIAHPGRYRLSSGGLRRLCGEFREMGGDGLEVISGSHLPAHNEHMARLAGQFSLLASCGSDYHGPEYAYQGLGRLQQLPAQCTPVWSDRRFQSSPSRARIDAEQLARYQQQC
ncbi:MAG: phosphoesterase [Gammaproteobacteria bacterium SG8_47]|nr:MAG: phosphoesterase [Gammaproteobacteria bacterium SG8_47]